ncbi:MAG: hypothetical protein ACUVRL_09345 [Candidatus Saccharicenans sp.]|uniref:hypothetical protein n=1 Tax=Candidatus Saccharicenans sp. TaxID=2819258 RepID=UPI00404B56D9
MNKKVLAIVFLAISFNLILIIQAGGQETPPGTGQRNLRQNLSTLRALRMTQVLELTEQQTAAIFPELNRAEKDKAELQRQLAAEIRGLREIIKAGQAQDQEFESRVRRVRELRVKIQERDRAFEDFLFSQLTSIQKARYIIFSLEFNRAIMERAQRLRPAGQKIK